MLKKIVFIAIFSFLILFTMNAKGASDRAYSEANELLEKKQNGLAIDSAIGVMDENIDASEAGIAIARKAMKSHSEFETKFDELLDLIYKNPNDNETKLKLVKELENIDTDMGPDMKYFLSKLKDSSIYAIYRIYFNRIMDEGIKLIKQEKFVEAANTFLTGFSIYADEFKEKYSGKEIFSDTNYYLDYVRDLTAEYEDYYAKFAKGVKEFNSTSNVNDATVKQKFNNVKSNFDKLIMIANGITDSGNSLKQIYISGLKKDEGIKETVLPFSYRLTIGRDSASYYEGVDGAIQASLVLALASLVDTRQKEIKKIWVVTCDMFDFKNDNSITNNISTIESNLDYLKNIYVFYESSISSRFHKKDGYNKKYSQMIDLIEDISQTKEFYSKFLDLKKRWDDNNTLASFSNEQNIDEVNNLNLSVRENYNDLKNIKNEKITEEKNILLAKQEILLKELGSLRLSLYEKFAKDKKEYGDKSIISANAQYAKSRSYLNFEQNGKIINLPNQALAGFKKLKKNVQENIKVLDNFLTKVKDDKALSSEIFEKNKVAVKTTKEELSKLLGIINNEIATTDNSLLQIQLAKNEADLRYNEAIRSLKKGDFDEARRKIERSRDKTNIALALEENDKYRKMTDERLASLGKKINDAENAVVVRDVRRFLENAKTDYFNGEFQKAENKLNLAKNRWAVTNVEPNEEVMSWLGIVLTAGSLKTGRVIPVSAPLYPQMSQLLNSATRMYLDSSKKINTNKRKEVIENLNEAKENIKQVLLVYPFNAMAGQLNLKIDKLIDPNNFTSQFKKKVSVIRKEYRKNPQRHYSDLLDLYSIDSKFPSIKSLKDEIEIYLGLKLPPPDLKAIAEAKRLIKSARQIYNGGNKLLFPAAVEQLDKVIAKDSTNLEAIKLKDALQMAMGGKAVIVLSATNEEKYKRAIEELQKGNKIIASALVEQLMQNPNAKNSAKVIELKKRLDAQL